MEKNIISRKQAIKQIGDLVMGTMIFPAIAAARVKQPDRPNFLWIITEDCSASYFGCYGDKQATTPNIDKLASEGILYKNACCQTPVCAPSRSTFMTGVYDNSMGTQHMRSFYSLPDFIKFYPYYLEKAGYYCTNRSKVDYNTAHQERWKTVWNECGPQASYRNRASGQPFHETVTLLSTHEHVIFDWIPENKLGHHPGNMHVPAYLPDTPEVRHDLAQYHDFVQKDDEKVGEILHRLERDGEADNTIVFLFSDHGGVLPRSKRFMFESGMQVPLIIRFPKKYQNLAPSSPGSISDHLVNLIDLAPSIFSLAGMDIPKYYQGNIFLGPKRKKDVQYVYGSRGRMDGTYDNIRTVRDKNYRYIRNYMPNRIYGQHIWYLWKSASMQSWVEAYERGQCNQVQKLFWEPKPPEELYDIRKDPDNVKNLAGDPDYDHILIRMREANDIWVRQIYDAGFMPEAMMVTRAGKAGKTIYEYIRSDAYPKEKIISMAELASMGKTGHLAKLRNGLQDEDSAVRYWAAYGCAILKENAMEAKQPLLKLLDDPCAIVAMAAAEALFHMDEKEKSFHALGQALNDDYDKVRLYALNVIRTFGQDAMPLLPQLQEFLIHPKPHTGENYETRVASYIVVQLTKGMV
jgi:arylsulfatase A-like enzyme